MAHSSMHALSRREALGTLAAAASLAADRASGAEKRAAAPAIAKPAAPSLHVYSDYGWLRGFSVVPSWGARIEEAWWSYEPARFRDEIAPAKSVHANCIRLWIEFTAWMAAPEQAGRRFLDAVDAIDRAGMKTMPCLFNRWHDFQWDYGGTYTEDLFRDLRPKLDYVRAIVRPLAGDARILMWDLCNEPQAQDLQSDVNKKEYAWLEAVAATVRQCGAKQPITIGTMTGGNIETFAPLCDVLCGHPYAHTPEQLAGLIASFDAMRKKHRKPMVSNECIPGCLDDRRRADVARFYAKMLSEAGLGWMGWALREGKAISTRRDRYDANGLDGQGFHPFVARDGKLRPGLEFLTDKPARLPPWTRKDPS
jgi:hypothetical protein